MSKKWIPQCSGCRKHKDIVVRTRGMNYCDDCKHKAPTRVQFQSFIDANVVTVYDDAAYIKRRKSGLYGGH